MLTGGRLTLEDAYAYAKFARVALASNDIDMRARPHSAEETEFLADRGGRLRRRHGRELLRSLEQAPAVLLAGFEPEDESPIVFLRLRKAARTGRTPVYSVAALASPGLARMCGTLLPSGAGNRGRGCSPAGRTRPAPGRCQRAADDVLCRSRPGAAPAGGGDPGRRAARRGTRRADRGRRLAERTGARLAWIPRRAGERGAIEAGALPVLLPGGRRVTDAAARADVARAWGVGSLPAEPGRDTGEILAAAAAGEIDALLVGGVDPADLPDPQAALAAIEQAGFVVSLELRASAVTDRADVVLPVAAVAEKPGTFVNWEGRPGEFGAALAVPVRPRRPAGARGNRRRDGRPPWPARAAAARRELAALGVVGDRDGPPAGRPCGPPSAGPRLRRSDRAGAPFPWPARRCWPPGIICSTPAGCRTASRTWPGPPVRPSRGCRRRPRPRPASATA